jgi:Tol biopolymer transport system component/predicted Ser/Thr protein kinase
LALSPGNRLGPYEIVSPLGAGGMGEVYRAKDTRLDREVAVKILPADFAANPMFKARFEREAKAISQLSHPNVCSLFDVGNHEGTEYLVMELIEGESLGDRLAKGRLPIEQVLKHGIEIASALDAAHRQGIVHRDLKPGNVMLTKTGAKLLDFGLAKSGPLITTGTLSESRMADSPTVHQPLTEQGTIIGTFQYMAPEQLEGMEADERTDIFAFGALLYQMATGQPAFAGKTRTSLIASIVSGHPQPVSQIAPLTPPALDHLIKKCLEKDPDDRWQSARDVADQMRWILDAGSRAGEAAPVLAKRRARARFAWVANVATAAVAVLATVGFMMFTKVPPRVVRSSLLPPEHAKYVPNRGAMVLSPDGLRIAFVARDDNGTAMLWVRPLDALTAQPLAGTDDAAHPFWSPDSRFLGFFSSGKLRKIDANGGPPQTLCDATAGRGGAWSADGTILFTPSTTDVLYKVSAAGGAPVAVTEFDSKTAETSHRFPVFLPDGKHFLFLVEGRPDAEGFEDGFALFSGSLGSKERKRLLATDTAARYARSGYLLFLRDRTLMAQRLDAGKLELVGDAVPVAENLTRSGRYESTFSVSDNDLLAFQAGSESELSQLVWIDRDGRDLETVGKPADYRSIALSHDGRRVAASILDPKNQKTDIWALDLERGTSTRLTFDPADDYSPIWSPDDRRVYFTSNRQGRGDVYQKSSSGTGTDEIVLADPDLSILWSLSADGRTGGIMTNNSTKKTGWDISIFDLTSGKARVFLETPFHELLPALSADGRWIAYMSNESGQYEIYVQSLGNDGGKWQISTEGGGRPMWTADNTELVYQAPDDKLMVVDVKFTPAFTASVPRVLVDPKIRQIVGIQYALSPDAKRILVNRAVEQTVITPVTLVQNWEQGLGR